ncbi:MAG TPA: polyprenyl synthetase family protein [Dehalococcoidia bacterium]|nr:polyprenyl synthetase family protein [Dehalococcoidia bacterium]
MTTTTAALYGPVQEDMSLVEERLIEVKQVDHPWLAQMLEAALAAGGKRLRPAVALLSGKFHTYDLPRLATLAAALELLHTATLVHDDVIDNASTRRGRPTVNAQFKNAVTVMLGDYMFANAAVLISQTEHVKVIENFSRSLMMIATGELGQDLSTFDTRQDIRSYLQRIGGKTAALFRTAGECGALLSNAPSQHVGALRDYGYHLGMAFQIVDDILDFTGDEADLGKPVGSDLMQGTLTLPALIFLEREPANNPITKLFRARRNRQSELLIKAVHGVLESGAIEEARRVAEDFAARARDALAPLPLHPARQTLAELTYYVLNRKS